MCRGCRARRPEGEDSMNNRKLTETVIHFGGVVAAAWEQGHTEQLEKPSPPPARNHRKKSGLNPNQGACII